MNERAGADGWIGASLLRKEDARHLYGHGMFIADVQVPGVQDVAFVRSPLAHARVRRVSKPAHAAARVFTLADIGPIKILEAGPELSAHRHSPYPPLADDCVRYVGQTLAACVMPTRAQAEDLADKVDVELEELPAVVDVVAAMRPESPRVFEEWPSNAYISTTVIEGNPETLASAPIRLRRRLRLNRQATVSLEGRGVLAYWDHRLDELVVYLSTQGGQVKRLALSRMLGIAEHKVRVIAPDVGGGFGGKNRIMPEDVAVAAIAMKVGHPVRWIEDRREHLLASPHARDHTYDLVDLCRAGRHAPGHRGRHLHRRGGLRFVADGRLSGSEHGVPQPDRALSHAAFEAQRAHGRHQQGTDGPVSRRRAAGGHLCTGTAGR